MPPTAVSRTDDNDKKLSPHKYGIYPPIAEPTNRPSQIRNLEFILLF